MKATITHLTCLITVHIHMLPAQRGAVVALVLAVTRIIVNLNSIPPDHNQGRLSPSIFMPNDTTLTIDQLALVSPNCTRIAYN